MRKMASPVSCVYTGGIHSQLHTILNYRLALYVTEVDTDTSPQANLLQKTTSFLASHQGQEGGLMHFMLLTYNFRPLGRTQKKLLHFSGGDHICEVEKQSKSSSVRLLRAVADSRGG